MKPHAAPRCYALLPCAGTGSRAGTAMPKQYALLAGRSLVDHTVQALLAVTRIDQLCVVISPDDTHWRSHGAAPHPRLSVVRCGGATRAQSVFQGLQALAEQGAQTHDWVLVHDAARCLIEAQHVNALIDACTPDSVGALLGVPVPDTLKAEVDGRVQHTLPREHTWLAQTPQMFSWGLLHSALLAAQAQGFAGITDEASAVEAQGHAPRLVRGSTHNIKVTWPEDFALAEALIRSRS
jgi:2-C-methyl-D-erythritol 4-phosphate cytidylyltransferase